MIRAIQTDSGVNLGASIQGSFVIRLAIFILAGAALVLAAGCSAILQPIEQRYLFRPWNPPSTAYLASVVSRGDGIEEIRLKTPDGVALHGWLKRPQAYRGGARRETSWMIVLAENDDITPTERGVALARAWGGPQRTMTLAGARHYGIERRDEFWKAVREFLGEIDSAGSLSKGYAMDPDFRR